ncbi:hypothetical protein ABZ599_38860 [Streptomyces misionensis]|uniref:hypothetical protein n=1 Tax=Streptomyces misionensis TaxID=67331 RepID=UPI0033C77B81
MAKWWPFGRKKEEAPKEAPPKAPAPEPTPAPPPTPEPTPAEGEKKRGLFGRLREKIQRKPKEAPPEAPAEAPPAAPTPPPAEEAPPEAAPEEAAAPPAAPPEAERTYPSFLHVEADGDWVISDTQWSGTMSGTLHGSDVKLFIDAMEAKGGPDYETAIPLIADAYGIPGGLINVGASQIHSVHY